MMMFAKRYQFSPSMAPFVERKVGTEWFTREFPATSPDQQAESMSSKPPTPSKRKIPQTTTSDDEDKSPPRTRQATKKRQKSTIPLTKEKGSGTLKLTPSSDKVSSDESPLKVASIPRRKSHILSPVLEDVNPIATIVPTVHAEESHSNDASPPTHQDKDMEENPQCSNSGNVVEQPTGSEDIISEHEAADETSNLPTPSNNETSTFGTIVTPAATSKQIPAVLTPTELEQLKNTDPVSFLKTMMNADNVSPIRLETSSNVLAEGEKVDEQLKAKVTSHSSSWKAAGDATKKADALKLERLKRQKEYETCRANIESWEQEIKRLEEQIKTARSRQEEIKQSQQEELTEVAQLGIRHLETTQKLVPEIEELKKQQELIERRLSLWESQYSKMKDNLPKDFD
ncbi:nucleolin 2-like [Vicia villosa]|uniref:nucleolin 2-like n=1 Tax=Vicia villosa TaxID=3911 RepID=UPI00273BC8DA|nr:nucleolin 2-like [Vicia villosa]